MSDLDLAFDDDSSVSVSVESSSVENESNQEIDREVDAGESRNDSGLNEGESGTVDESGASESSQTEENSEDNAEQSKPEDDSSDKKEQEVIDWEKQAKAFKAKALDEKNKRQALEESQKARQQAQPMPDALDDPEGFAARIKSDVQKEALNARANISEKYARKTMPDFDEKWPLVQEFLKSTPEATKDVLSSEDPYGTAFELFDQAKQIEKFKDPNFLENERARIRAEIMAEMKQQEPVSKTQGLTPSLARLNGSGASTGTPEVSTNLDDIFKD